jgi:hypothetical protein
MSRDCQTIVRRGSASRVGVVDVDEIRRSLGRQFALPLIAAGLIALAEITLTGPSEKATSELRATPEPTINAPAFVRPSAPPPDDLIGPRVPKVPRVRLA